MMNNVVLVGRVVEEPKIVELDTGYKVCNFVLAVQRPFRNENNEYETDFIPITTWMGIAELICEYVGKGSILALKCRLSTRIVEVKDTRLKSIDVVCERVSFIKLESRSDNQKKKEGKKVVKDNSNEEDELTFNIDLDNDLNDVDED